MAYSSHLIGPSIIWVCFMKRLASVLLLLDLLLVYLATGGGQYFRF